MMQTTHDRYGFRATSAGLVYMPAGLSLGFAQRAGSAFLAEPQPGWRISGRVLSSVPTAALQRGQRRPLAMPWHQALTLGPTAVALAPAGSGLGSALLQLVDATGSALDARWAGAQACGCSPFDGVPQAQVVVLDTRRAQQPTTTWDDAVQFCHQAATSSGVAVCTSDAVVGALLLVELLRGGRSAIGVGAVQRTLAAWLRAGIVEPAVVQLQHRERADLVIGDPMAPLLGRRWWWLGEDPPAAGIDNSLAFSRFAVGTQIASIAVQAGATTALLVGPLAQLVAGQLAEHRVHAVHLQARQLPLPSS
ncbi:MAG: hypothetical protein EXR77_13925 [Myxococcales bacterium]|nr:hypothetical protein [Myxococcales bacterium]